MAMAWPSFLTSSRKGDAWFFAGLTSSFPNLTESGHHILDESGPCGDQESRPGCKVFQVPSEDSSQAKRIDEEDMILLSGDALKDQVLIFQYKGKFHAVDNKCPHSSFPLAKGTPFDIEDFGVVLSAGITCPKHGWAFDLFTGQADKSNYLLRRWEVQLRPLGDAQTDIASNSSHQGNEEVKEVWIRRRQRMG